MLVNGTVKTVKKGQYGWGMLLEETGDRWFNSKWEIKAAPGDVVTFDDGGKNYVKQLKKADPDQLTTTVYSPRSHDSVRPAAFPIPIDSRERSIVRQNALTNARETILGLGNYTGTEPTESIADKILDLARIFEAYTSGDEDMINARNILRIESSSH